MVTVCALNVRGINKSLKQADLHSFLVDNNISLAGLLETKIKSSKSVMGHRTVHNFWRWETNYQHHPNGRIWVGWNPNIWNVFVECKSDQFTHCKATLILSQEFFYFTFIYASNDQDNKLKLWSDLASLDTYNLPWSILGDFNTIQDLSESTGGNEHWTRDM